MRTTIIISIMLCLGVVHYSCKTKTVQNDMQYTATQNSPVNSILPESEMKVIKSLFDSNRMSYANYQFYQLNTDDLGFTHVRCYQFVNNLKVFSEELIFHFNKNNEHYLTSGNIINSIGLDTNPSLNRDKAAEIFIRRTEQEKAPTVDPAILKGSFDIEFGYTGLDDSSAKFAKAWKVKPAGKAYPFAYINDDNSEIIFYDNGVRTSKPNSGGGINLK